MSHNEKSHLQSMNGRTSTFHYKALVCIFLLTLMTCKKADAFDLGPFDVSVKFCRDTKKIGTILNAFQFNMWPVAGLPGIATGLSMRTSPVVDSCNYIIQLSQADTLGALNMAADALNKLTSEKHDRSIQTTKAIFSLSNSFYDLKSGKRRPGSMDALSTANNIGNFMRKYGNMKRKWDKEDHDQEVYEQNQERIKVLAATARDRAIISDMMSCPDSSKNPDFDKIYKEKYEAVNKRIKSYGDDYEYTRAKIDELAMKFFPTFEMYTEFTKKLNTAIVSGVFYEQVQNGTKKIDNHVKTGKVNAEGVAETENKPVEREVFEYRAKENTSNFNVLRGYTVQYKEWLRKYWKESLKVKDEDLLKQEFKTINVECAPESIASELDPNDPDSDKEYQLRKERCELNSNMSLKVAENLYANLIDYLKNSLLKYKKANAQLWTYDSEYRGLNRVITIAPKNEYKEEKVSCSSELQMADMQLLSLKQEEASNKYNAMIAEEMVKQNAIMEKENQEKMEARKRLQYETDAFARKEQDNEEAMRQTKRGISLEGSESK